MKYVVLFLLVLLGVFLYKRAKRLANEEQQVHKTRTYAGQSETSTAEVDAAKPVEETPSEAVVAAEPEVAKIGRAHV